MPPSPPTSPSLNSRDYLWDLWCLFSVVGIWPRFIEPKLLKITKKNLYLKNLDPGLEDFTILHFGDCHLHKSSCSYFFQKAKEKVASLSPDLILFSGDFICYGQLDAPKLFTDFFKQLPSRYGLYASLGNHDYQSYVSSNPYPLNWLDKHFPICGKIYHQYLEKKKPQSPPPYASVDLHQSLLHLMESCQVQLLHNRSICLDIKGTPLNLVGVGDLWTQHFLPKKAFKNLSSKGPTLLLSHNPDSLHHGLIDYPFDILFAGHTHGSQVNLPYLGIAPTNTHHNAYTRGHYSLGEKQVYVTRGLSSHLPFRWFSPPEIALFTLKRAI